MCGCFLYVCVEYCFEVVLMMLDGFYDCVCGVFVVLMCY